jgi:hypothetical protein
MVGVSKSTTIVINSSNYDPSTGTFIYKFPTPQTFKNMAVGVQSVNFYNSFFNISTSLYNNTISIIFPFSSGNQTFNYTFDNGYFAYSDMNYALQSFMITNKLYYTNSSGQNVYFVEIVPNSIRYAGEINVYPVPTSATATANGWTLPAGQSLYGNGNCPQVVITSSFGSLLGLTAGTYGGGSTALQIVSSVCPIISPINAIVMTCNLINNAGISNPTNVIQIVPLNAQYGGLVQLNIGNITYQEIANNFYTQIQIGFLDQNFNRLTSVLDTDVIFTLSIAGIEQ